MKDIPNSNEIEFLKYLLEEYKYRHDLIWRLLFRFSEAIILLGIIPYAYSEIATKVGRWIILLPLIAMILSIIGFAWMKFELELFGFIDSKYNEHQSHMFNLEVDENKPNTFRLAVLGYHSVLILLTVANVLFFICAFYRP